MLDSTSSASELQQIRELAAPWGNIVARRAFGDHGPGLQVNLTTLEAVAQAAAAGLLESTLALLLEQQAQALGPTHSCPDCGRDCLVRREPRLLQVDGGHQLRYAEPICSCPGCRRDFFPSAAAVAAGRPRL